MSKLADNIRKAAMEKKTADLPTGTATQDAQAQMAITATGKAQSAGQNLKQSNIQEQMGMLEAREAQTSVQQQGLEQASQVAAQEAEQEMKVKQVESANRVKQIQFETEQTDMMDKMLSNMQYEEAQLEDRKDALQLEQVGASLRMNDQKYRHELEMVGARNRIDNEASIAKEAERLVIGNQTQALYDDLSNSYVLNELERADTWQTAKMNLNDALKIAKAKISDQTKAMQTSALRDIGSAGYVAADESGALDEWKTSAKNWWQGDTPTAAENSAQQSLVDRFGEDDEEKAFNTFMESRD